MRRPRAAAAFLALLALGAASPSRASAGDGAGASADAAGPRLLDLGLRSPLEFRGEIDALAMAWIEAIEKQPERAAGALLAARLGELTRDLRDLEALAEPLRRLVAAPELEAGLREELREILVEIHRRAGRDDEAEALEPRRGYLTRWAVLGPLGRGLRSDLEQRYAAERAIDFAAAVPGVRRTLSWQSVPRRRPSRFLDAPGELGSGAGVYLHLSQLESPARARVLVEVRTESPVHLSVNGRRIAAESDSQFLASPRRYAAELVAGWNRVLVKSLGGPFAIRLTDAGGRPLAADAWREEPALALHPPAPDPVPGAPEAAAPSAGAAAVPWAWEEALAAGAGEAETADRALAAAYLERACGRGDRAAARVESALALAPEDAAVLYHAGALYRQGLQVPSSYARRRARSLFEKAAKLCKGAPPDAAAESTPALPVDLELARLAYEDEQTLAALELLGGIQSRHPGHAPALRLELGIFEERGWAAEAADAARRLEARCPRAIEPQLHFARAAASRGAIGEAAARYEEAYSRDQRRTDVLDELVEIDVRRGKLDAARARLERWLAAHPDDRRARSHLARLLLDGDLGSEALALLEQSAAERPRDPRAWRELAQAHERLGRGPDARRAYQRVLEIEPGDLAVRAYLHHLEGRPQDRFWEAHDEALEDWIDKLPEASRHPNAGSLAVLDIAVLRLYPDGSSSEYTHQAHLLFNDSDKDARAQVETQGEIRLLRTRTPDGRFLEPVAATGRRQFVMPGLEPGAIVEFAYLREESRFSGWLFGKAPFFFQDHSYREPMLLSRYVLLLPPGLDVSLLERSLSGSAAAGDGSGLARVARTETALPDGGRAIVYEARDVPRIEPERPMPPREDYLPNVALVERAGWDEVARALAQPAAGRDRVTPLLASWASEATLGIAEPAAKVHALYRKVNEWVTAERGPADAQGILLEKAGDRNVLLKALLEAAGITASWAFVRSRDGLEPTRGLEHPQPGLFDERLLHVEIAGGDSLWLTLDARHAPLGKLPAEWQGSPALVLRPGGADLFEVPQADPETLGESAEVSISLKADGSAAVRVKTTSRSFGAYIQKPAFEALDAQRRRNSLSRFGAALFPGARVRRVELPDLERLGAPLCIEMELEAPRLLQSSGAESLLRSVYPPLQLVNSAIGLARRVHPYHMGAPAFRSDRVRIELGERLRLARVPPSTALFGPLGSYSLRFEPQGSVIGIERRLILRGGLLTAAEFPRLAEFAREVDEAESGRIVLESAAE